MTFPKVDEHYVLVNKLQADLSETLGPWFERWQKKVSWPTLAMALSDVVTHELRGMAKKRKKTPKKKTP